MAGVGHKLCSPHPERLACVAEELARHVIIERAKALVEIEGADVSEDELDDLYDLAYEDTDFLLLSRDDLDGIEPEQLPALALGNLEFSAWFTPFNRDNPVHPYVAPDPAAQ